MIWGKSYVKNCTIMMRADSKHPLVSIEDGELVIRLDGYAIMPIEEYNLIQKVKENSNDQP